MSEIKNNFAENHESLIIVFLYAVGIISICGIIFQAVFYPQFLVSLILVMIMYSFWTFFNNYFHKKCNMPDSFNEMFKRVSTGSFYIYMLVLFISAIDCTVDYLKTLTSLY